MEGQCISLRRIDVADLVREIVAHQLYRRINDEESLRLFMTSHVFCVWDFQSLLKSLQQSLTCVTVPWLPTHDREARRLINEIVLDEESDEDHDGGYCSHFELYLEAMKDCGADRAPINNFIEDLRRNLSADEALERAALPQGVKEFVSTTLTIAGSKEAHRVAAAFTLGREDLIPEMFQQLVSELSGRNAIGWSKFLHYLNGHIESDGEQHGPLSRSLLARLCGEDERLRAEAEETARVSLTARLKLWDHILDAIPDAR
jgi:hypothetical protein